MPYLLGQHHHEALYWIRHQYVFTCRIRVQNLKRLSVFGGHRMIDDPLKRLALKSHRDKLRSPLVRQIRDVYSCDASSAHMPPLGFEPRPQPIKSRVRYQLRHGGGVLTNPFRFSRTRPRHRGVLRSASFASAATVALRWLLCLVGLRVLAL